MSPAGVTHFHSGEITFCSLEQWERDYAVNAQLQRLTVFRDFRRWKALRLWRRAVRGKRTKQCQEVLGSNLFAVQSVLRTALVQIRYEPLGA